MSLHTLAHHLQSAGRGDDKVLVHMTPGEVHGLQALAKAHGGSLTTNPETGLPEAGFLSSLLPMAIGFGLAPITGGLSAALITGAGYTAATGSLKKGLMAGLGAYGGAGLMEGLTAAGADAAAANAVTAPTITADSAANAVYLGQPAGYATAQGVEGVGSAYADSVNAARQAAMETPFNTAWQGVKSLGTEGGRAAFMNATPYSTMAAAAAPTISEISKPKTTASTDTKNESLIRPYEYTRTQNPEAYNIGPPMWAENPGSTRERTYFTDNFTALKPYKAPGPEYAAKGGLMGLAVGGPVEQMAAMNAVGENTGYPQANLQTPMYANPSMQRPVSTNVIAPSADAGVDPYTGEARFASGGISQLGDYSDGGRLLKGPGDGVSDSIPASIGDRQPARLADGEFVVPARIVSEIGNGSTEAGARKLYAMMDRVQKARKKTVGKDQVARNTKAENLLPV